ncbi:S-layer homology domain-containing protein [Feifania hominis]|uniref:S-layer homology domain-containing protein n=1 Tax=Feifania hominis TaxID=2763660 RepID=A0A926DDW9_9FIRM|nr:S-layer homology domain-containing protein [Feifania hominis]MBC8536019.1 S-layer homology domain-containing protein [Feifania hominis]
MKKICSLLLTLVLVFSFASSAMAFSDIQDANVSLAAETLVGLGVLDGFGDGTFRPGDQLTRAQFTKMIVSALDVKAMLSLYKDFTIFPDVPHTHWAASYINYAVKMEKPLIGGYADGTFKPDQSITNEEAVTIALRVLGYTVEDIGANWPASYIEKAAAIGLTDGVNVRLDTPMLRGDAAVLIANMLVTPVRAEGGREGSLFVTTLGKTTQDNVMVLATGATDSSLSEYEIKTDSEAGTYTSKFILPAALVGTKGILIVDGSGQVNGFVPYKYNTTVVNVSETTGDYIKGSDGKTYRVSANTPVVIKGQKKAFNLCWFDITPGMVVSIFTNDSGAIEYLSTVSAVAGVGPYVVTSDGSSSYNPLAGLFPSTSGAKIIKNGVEVGYDKIKKYDVATYSAATNTINVSDNKLSGRYEDAYPSFTLPSEVTVLGTKFVVSANGAADFKNFKLMDAITLLFAPDGTVAGAVRQSELQAEQYGIVKSLSDAGMAVVTLQNGIEISGKSNLFTDEYVGQLVRVYTGSGNSISLRPVTSGSVTGSLDVKNRTVGKTALSPSCKIYEKMSSYAPLMQISLSDIKIDTVPSSMVELALTDSTGTITTLVLRDVTGSGYIYGLTKASEDSVSIRYVNDEGQEVTENYSYNLPTTSGLSSYGGITVKSGRVLAVSPVRYEGTVALKDFDTDQFVKIDGKFIPIAQDVIVYAPSADKIIALDKAKSMYTSFKIFINNTVETGGMVRIIEVS